MFHYAWLFLSIVLVVGELSEDSQFPIIDRDLRRLQSTLHFRQQKVLRGSARVKSSGCSWK